MESAFVGLLASLAPAPGYMRLFNAIVLDVWKDHQRDAERLRTSLGRLVAEKRARLDRVDDAFLHERSIDRANYERQRDQLREQVALAEIELSDAVAGHLDVEGILGFAEHLLTDVSRLWVEAPLDQKQRLQQVLFPEGLKFDGKEFGTVATCLAFKQLAESEGVKSSVASPTGFEPVF